MKSPSFSSLEQEHVEPELSVTALSGVMHAETATSDTLMGETLQRGEIKSEPKERGEIGPADSKAAAHAAEICLKAKKSNVIS